MKESIKDQEVKSENKRENTFNEDRHNICETEENLYEDIEWDGTESELIMDNHDEEYEEKMAGIKLKYTLLEKEIINIFKYTEGYKKNLKLQKIHTAVQTVLFFVLLILWRNLGSTYYLILSLFPLTAVMAIWIAPLLSMKSLAKKLSSGEELNVEVFPDKILVDSKRSHREILLDGTSECEQMGGVIIVRPKEGNMVLIPIRSIEPEFLPDIQAMILAGSQPKYEK